VFHLNLINLDARLRGHDGLSLRRQHAPNTFEVRENLDR